MDKTLALLGGAAWINLANTEYVHNRKRMDVLEDRLATLHWLEINDLLRAVDYTYLQETNAFHAMLDELVSLRSICQDILSTTTQKGALSPFSVKHLHEWVEKLSIAPILVQIKEKLSLRYEGKTTSDHICYQLLHSIIQTVETIPYRRIRKCEHEECTLYFVDTSKSGKRRWCSMEFCGNRYKAAKYYAKKRGKKST